MRRARYKERAREGKKEGFEEGAKETEARMKCGATTTGTK